MIRCPGQQEHHCTSEKVVGTMLMWMSANSLESKNPANPCNVEACQYINQPRTAQAMNDVSQRPTGRAKHEHRQLARGQAGCIGRWYANNTDRTRISYHRHCHAEKMLRYYCVRYMLFLQTVSRAPAPPTAPAAPRVSPARSCGLRLFPMGLRSLWLLLLPSPMLKKYGHYNLAGGGFCPWDYAHTTVTKAVATTNGHHHFRRCRFRCSPAGRQSRSRCAFCCASLLQPYR